MNQGEFDEYHVITEALPSINEAGLGEPEKQEPPLPDFRIPQKSDSEPVWVEITQVPEAEGEVREDNVLADRFRIDLRSQLEQDLSGSKYGHLNATIWLSRRITVSERAEALKNFSTFLQEKMPDLSMNSYEGNDLPDTLQPFTERVMTHHMQGARTLPALNIDLNTQYLDPETLPERIKETVVRKEAKDYRKSIGDQKLWLIIRLDGVYSLTDLDRFPVAYESEVFDKVYVQSQYEPGSQSYPLRLISSR